MSLYTTQMYLYTCNNYTHTQKRHLQVKLKIYIMYKKNITVWISVSISFSANTDFPLSQAYIHTIMIRTKKWFIEFYHTALVHYAKTISYTCT